MTQTVSGHDEQPFVIGPRAGENPQCETMVSMLQSARLYLLTASRDLTPAQLGAVPDRAVNSIGALLSHLAAVERMFQNLLFRGYQFSDEEREEVEPAFRFRRDPLSGAGIDAYHARLDDERRETLALFAGVDDAWLAGLMTFAGRDSNRHYYWLHFLMDEARHTGQIILLRKHLLADADPSFDPFALR